MNKSTVYTSVVTGYVTIGPPSGPRLTEVDLSSEWTDRSTTTLKERYARRGTPWERGGVLWHGPEVFSLKVRSLRVLLVRLLHKKYWTFSV